MERRDGTPSPVRAPQDVDMIIFRENSEDVYAGIEWEAGTDGVQKLIDFLQNEMGVDKSDSLTLRVLESNRYHRKELHELSGLHSNMQSIMTKTALP